MSFNLQVLEAPASVFDGDPLVLAIGTSVVGEGSSPADPSSLSVVVGPVGRPDLARRYDVSDPHAVELRHVSTGVFLLTAPPGLVGAHAWAVTAQLLDSGENGGDGKVLYLEGKYSVLARAFG